MIRIGGRAHTIEQIHEVGKLGYPFAEIDIKDPKEIEDSLDALSALKEKYDLYYLAHYPNENNPMDPSILAEKFVPKMKRLITLTSRLGIKKATMHFWMDKRWAGPSLISEKIKLLAELVDHAAMHNIILCIENLTSQYESFSDIFKVIPELRMTMDIGHGEILSDENTAFGFMAHVFEKIAHVHVHDNFGGTSVKDDLHLSLGKGCVNYPEIFKILKEKGYDDTITLEVKPEDMPSSREEVVRYLF